MKPFLKQHKKNLKKLTRKQLIQQIINHIELHAQVENQFNDSYEELFQESLQHKRELEGYKTRSKIQFEEISNVSIELEETQEALSRSRNHIEIYKEQIDRQLLLIKRLERGITNTWYVADSLEVIKELPGGIEEDMIEYKLFDRDQGKYALLLK